MPTIQESLNDLVALDGPLQTSVLAGTRQLVSGLLDDEFGTSDGVSTETEYDAGRATAITLPGASTVRRRQAAGRIEGNHVVGRIAFFEDLSTDKMHVKGDSRVKGNSVFGGDVTCNGHLKSDTARVRSIVAADIVSTGNVVCGSIGCANNIVADRSIVGKRLVARTVMRVPRQRADTLGVVPRKGYLMVDTRDDTLRFYNGTVWLTVATV